MKNKNIIGILVMTSLVATSLAFAEEASVSGEVNANVNAGMMAPRPPMDGERAPERPRGFMKRIFDGGEGSNADRFAHLQLLAR